MYNETDGSACLVVSRSGSKSGQGIGVDENHQHQHQRIASMAAPLPYAICFVLYALGIYAWCNCSAITSASGPKAETDPDTCNQFPIYGRHSGHCDCESGACVPQVEHSRLRWNVHSYLHVLQAGLKLGLGWRWRWRWSQFLGADSPGFPWRLRKKVRWQWQCNRQQWHSQPAPKVQRCNFQLATSNSQLPSDWLTNCQLEISILA